MKSLTFTAARKTAPPAKVRFEPMLGVVRFAAFAVQRELQYCSPGEEYDTLISMWPVLQGQRRAEDANSRLSAGHQPSVDVVSW